MRKLLLAFAALAAACHSSSPQVPVTDVRLESPGGTSLTGIVHFYSPQTNLEQDNCSLQSTSCSVRLPTGSYDLVMIQDSAFGPSSVTAPTGGCFMASVHVTAGQPLLCRQNGRAGCRGFANLECGVGNPDGGITAPDGGTEAQDGGAVDGGAP